ncbi:ribonuclease HII [Limosilactobacillus sp. STM2_1]|uniref:Ribonuclease HII n=1 Tax=Limosilactobacillus rudii TaxID=2759755 RepID=A0A7W3YN80_9LACO|nr:ribonuclease HII [Limosilactobacillus rudii]MBB1079103.1 ribonuclease HII [Limosilactobacillus rudii]MBB1097022.1 ribonuclease HII [Limosilactobacillus rudii]MCD7133990.1 ribonuclease HII [Limosilactobacillus rudii]
MSKETISQIKEHLLTVQRLDDPYIQSIVGDSRKGVQTAIGQLKRRLARQHEAYAAFKKRFKYEEYYWQSGCQYVAGMDEVGRGPLAGPVVTCAVILNADFDLVGVTDSKQLSRHERENLYLKIINEAVEVSIAVNDRDVIDKLNIYAATQDAMIRAVNQLHHRPDHLIVDAVPLAVDIPQTTLIKGDQKSISVAAASIVAKEYRDHLMRDYDYVYPGYGFAQNMGYGTKEHLAGLAKLGACPIHRRSFNPVPKYLN